MNTMKYRSRRKKVVGAFATFAVVALTLSACTSGQVEVVEETEGTTTQTTDGPIVIAYLQNLGDQQYFIDEANGAKAGAEELGDVEIRVVDLEGDATKTIDAVELSVSQGVDGIVIVIPDPTVGPKSASAARAAGIPIMASDVALLDDGGEAIPFVGFDGVAMGNEVGKEAARIYLDEGWSASDTRILSAYRLDMSVCADRAQGAAEAFAEAVGDGNVPEIIEIGTDNSVTDAQDQTGAVITGNAGVKHWIAWGCNDENSTGIVTALQNSGVSADDIIGVGLGAYLTCKDWAAGQNTGNRSALFISGYDVGKAAVEAMVAHVRDGVPLPARSIADTHMVDSTNWEEAGVTCT